jgi:hypothetical protein
MSKRKKEQEPESIEDLEQAIIDNPEEFIFDSGVANNAGPILSTPVSQEPSVPLNDARMVSAEEVLKLLLGSVNGFQGGLINTIMFLGGTNSELDKSVMWTTRLFFSGSF